MENWLETSSNVGLIEGPTAFTLWGWRYRFTTISLAISLTTLIMNNSGMPQSWFTNTMVASLGLSLIPVIVLINWCAQRERAEMRAGYTTLRTRRNELTQRDPYLGKVIRPARATPLDRQHFLKIVAEAKSSAENR